MSRRGDHVGNREDLSMSWKPLRIAAVLGLLLWAIIALIFVRMAVGADVANLPTWMLPPAAVERAFEAVVYVRVVIEYPNRPAPPLNSVYALPNGSSGFFIREGFITAAHVFHAPDEGVGPGKQEPESGWVRYTGQLFVVGFPPLIPRVTDADGDVALFSAPDRKQPVVALANLMPPVNTLLWWICRAGYLRNEWSLGRLMGEIPPHAQYKHPVSLVNPLLGGVHGGCSGAPIFTSDGRVIGLISGFHNGGMLLNVKMIRLDEIRAAVTKAAADDNGNHLSGK